MKKIILLLIILLSGCATITNTYNIWADNGSHVTCTNNLDKPVKVETPIQGNLPTQGGTVSNPVQDNK